MTINYNNNIFVGQTITQIIKTLKLKCQKISFADESNYHMLSMRLCFVFNDGGLTRNGVLFSSICLETRRNLVSFVSLSLYHNPGDYLFIDVILTHCVVYHVLGPLCHSSR